MKKVSYKFNGTGATVYLCLGFIPDCVHVRSIEASNNDELVWYRDPGAAEAARGYYTYTGTTYRQIDARTVSDGGIAIYDGGDVMTAANQTSVGYGEGVYLVPDTRDFRLMSTDPINPGDGSGADVSSWTLDTLANKTGHFDADVVGTYVGEGSKVVIGSPGIYAAQFDYEATIMSLTAGQGISADEVTLDRAIPTGRVKFLGGKFTLSPLAIGLKTPAGIVLEMTTGVNVNDETQLVIAEKWDAI